MVMTKREAIEIFGSGAALGRALGVSRAAIWQWADQLDQKQVDMVVGAAIRLGKPLLAGIVPAVSAETAMSACPQIEASVVEPRAALSGEETGS